MSRKRDIVRLQVDRSTLTEADQGSRCSVMRNRLLDLLPHEVSAALLSSSKTVALEKGQVLTRVGEPIDYLYFPHGGIVSLMAELPDGRTIEIASVGMEGALGIAGALASGFAVCRSVVRVSGLATRIPAQKLARIADESKSLRTFVGLYSMVLAAQLKEMVVCTGFHDVEGRLSRVLLKARDRLACDTLPMTQEMLAEILGVRRTTVTAAARFLQSAEIIFYNRGAIEIRNEAALKRLACPCYSSMRRKMIEFFAEMHAASAKDSRRL